MLTGGWDRIWGAYLCAIQGHLVRGVGTGTGTGDIVWANYCERCGAKVGQG